MLKMMPIPAFKDNYFWLLINPETGACAVVDPGQAAPVREFLHGKDLVLEAILITHHHNDHVGGMLELSRTYSAPIYGPDGDGIRGIDIPLKAGMPLYLTNLDLNLEVIALPGHTHGHIGYLGPGIVFVGDTLFAAGCGRLFEGTPEQMFKSLQKLKELPDDTLVYCAHEYTLNNLKFAAEVEPNNFDIKQRIDEVTALRKNGIPSVPTKIGIEKNTNPFLRANTVEEFAKLRKAKDEF